MKKNILAVAIAGAMVAPLAANAAAPTLYGQFNVALDTVSENGTDLASRSSRLGVKGSEDLGNGLKVVYQLESGFNATGGGTLGATRNTFVGVAGGFGTIIAGRHDTPLRMIQPSDRFNDNANLGNNTSVFGGLATLGSGEDRLNDMVAYISPKFNNFQVIFGGVTTAGSNKDKTDDDKVTPRADDQNLGNAYSASLAYGSKKSGLYAAVALTERTKDIQASTDGDFDNTGTTNTRATVQYSDAGLVVSAMYNQVDTKAADANSAITLGAAYTMGALTPKAKVSMVDYASDVTYGTPETKAKDSTNYAIGLDYALGKKTRAVVEYGVLDKNNLAGQTVGDKDTSVFSVGLHHAF